MLDKCRLCGHNDLKLYFTEGVNDEFKYFRCMNCQLVNYDISSGFDQEKHTLSYSDPRNIHSKKNRQKLETFNFIQKHIPAPGSILDIGCHNGALLLLAKENGWTPRGIELFEELAKRTREATGIEIVTGDFLKYDILEDEQYDLVVMTHVLEHLPDPILAMQRIHSLLKENGVAILEFPNIRSPNLVVKYFLRRHGLFRWRRPDYVPHHAHEFCRSSFSYLLAKTGFQLEEWNTYSSKRMLSGAYRLLNFGTKTRVLIRKV